MANHMKRFTVTFTVEGVPGDPITKSYHDWVGTTRKNIKSRLTHEYGGRSVEILDLKVSSH